MNNDLKVWYSLEVTAIPEAAEAVEFALNSLDADGTSINHLKKQQAEDVIVFGYFEKLPDELRVKEELDYAMQAYGLSPDSVLSVNRSTVEQEDWLQEWKKHWKPTVVGGFVIAPPWETLAESDGIPIVIEPNMAFGTGTHETTRLCLQKVSAIVRSGDTVLDVGTGTGVLAIAAAKAASTKRIVACDTDADSVKIAIENAELNGVSDRIKFFEGTLSDEVGRFDVVFANLTIDVILPILPTLLGVTTRDLILSGILVEQKQMIENALAEQGVRDYSIDELGEWISVLVTI
jgi:ribosomal protein L11 methyltransferase